MGRGIVNSIVRDLERAARAAAREQARQVRENERTHRELLRQQAAAKKERHQNYVEARIQEVESKNRDTETYIATCDTILTSALTRDPRIDFKKLLRVPEYPRLNLSSIAREEPVLPLTHFIPRKPHQLISWLGWIQKDYENRCRQARRQHAIHLKEHAATQSERQKQIEALQITHSATCDAIRLKIEVQHGEIKQWIQSLKKGEPSAVADYFETVLETSPYPDGFPKSNNAIYIPESKQLLVECDLPSLDDSIPTCKTYKYIKSRDEIVGTAFKDAERRRLYILLVAQISLRTLHELFAGDPASFVDTIVLNAHVNAIDRANGLPVRPCLISVRTTADRFRTIDLRFVDPIECLESLSASVSKSPDELLPVRPILELNMVDRRFVKESDVVATLDQRPNLMDLTPGDFESLITNLFQRIGLETKQTQASRDGGVDCVAFDCRPIFGGKVVVQAKRYKNTVGVSAVRDLYGTMINEGASKGILVTTSGFGKASFEFANGKPIELLSGANLLHLLEEHTGIAAKIIMPVDWDGL